LQNKVLDTGSKTKLGISAKITTHTEDLRKFSPKIRGCYFENERKLKFYKIYTKYNCEIECMTNFTLKMCGCVNFGMARDKITKICNLNYKLCCEESSLKYTESNDTSEVMPCGCLPSCVEIEYKIDSEEFDFTRHFLDLGQDYNEESGN
jgi:amiloride-sensitive sodium channel